MAFAVAVGGMTIAALLRGLLDRRESGEDLGACVALTAATNDTHHVRLRSILAVLKARNAQHPRDILGAGVRAVVGDHAPHDTRKISATLLISRPGIGHEPVAVIVTGRGLDL